MTPVPLATTNGSVDGTKKAIPITVFTGFLGSGKTTTILSLLGQLPKDYNVVLLKNEFGDVEVDSQLAKQSSLTAVSEILNGCMCCILVGQMKNALLEIRDKFHPDRIIIETSGSAFPATLAFQIRDLEKETLGDFKLDAILTVIDAENFTGYEDTSVTAKMQAQYTDLILINKWENISERQLDIVLDHLFTLNDATPKLRCSGKNGVPPSLVFGLDSKLFLDRSGQDLPVGGLDHHNEVETATVFRGFPGPLDHIHDQNCAALASLSAESIYRVKGFITFADDKEVILNWAFGRFELVPVSDSKGLRQENAKRGTASARLTVMGERGEVKKWAVRLASALGAVVI
ncbi:hypothetical protein BOTBODRAFT_107848 [Botryobasidium botryosum FD-172 SS1]|uniref:CobW/HypB/UreG nucleotide-binding domain-containing protein n=1 Tax=Botryobasidium botryosum (strain FD-172 SS1) TaxID=930990 RepID=A0A067MVE4_BOTB1|nr:hypothetical protein BOTBODRAFT_107848 [Botryobasidium botryosum FD-172 SS1]